jgi:hypothetical protein
MSTAKHRRVVELARHEAPPRQQAYAWALILLFGILFWGAVLILVLA